MSTRNVNLQVIFYEEGKQTIAHAPALDLSTHGKNLSEAKKRFSELVEIFFDELEDAGTVEEVLSSLGWQRQGRFNTFTPPKVVKEESVSVQPPIAA